MRARVTNHKGDETMRFSTVVASICTVLLLIGCAGQHGSLMKQAERSYQANDYEAALRATVRALKLKPDYEKAQNLVLTFFNAAVERRQNNIKVLEAAANKFKWDNIVAEYQGLIEINDLVKNLPPLVHKETKRPIIFDIKDYSNQLGKALENAADAHYQEGIRIAASADDVDTQKRAAKEFKMVERFVRGYKDAQSRYEKSRSAGMKRIAFIPFEDRSGKRLLYGSLSEAVTDAVISNLLGDPSAVEFLQLISRSELERVVQEQNLSLTGLIDEKSAQEIGNVLGVHEIVTGQINQIIYSRPQTITSRYSNKATIRERRGTYIDNEGKERPRYVDVPVSAMVTKYQRKGSAAISGSYKIINVRTAQITQSTSFSPKHVFEVAWGTFSGDKRALSSESERLCLRSEPFTPSEQEMVQEAQKKLVGELSSAIKKYAR